MTWQEKKGEFLDTIDIITAADIVTNDGTILARKDFVEKTSCRRCVDESAANPPESVFVFVLPTLI